MEQSSPVDVRGKKSTERGSKSTQIESLIQWTQVGQNLIL